MLQTSFYIVYSLKQIIPDIENTWKKLRSPEGAQATQKVHPSCYFLLKHPSQICSCSRVTNLPDRQYVSWISCGGITESSVQGEPENHTRLPEHTEGCEIQRKISLKVFRELNSGSKRRCMLTQSLLASFFYQDCR